MDVRPLALGLLTIGAVACAPSAPRASSTSAARAATSTSTSAPSTRAGDAAPTLPPTTSGLPSTVAAASTTTAEPSTVAGSIIASTTTVSGTATSTAAPSTAAPSTTAPNAEPAVLDCGLGNPSVRPAELTEACGDGNSQLVHLVWTTWGATAAVGSGTESYNTCVPDCAESRVWKTEPAQVALTNPQQTSHGLVFTTMTVTTPGTQPVTVSVAPAR